MIAPPGPSKPAGRQLSLEDELERDLLGLADADGDAEDDFEEIVPASVAYRQEEEEEEEGEMEEEIFIPAAPVSPPKPKPKPAARVTKVAPKARPPVAAPAPAPVPPPPKPKPSQPKAKKPKREPEPMVLSEPEEEHLEFGKPAKPAQFSRPSEGLALPGASSHFAPPPPPMPHLPSAHDRNNSAGSSRAPIEVAPEPEPGSESDEEDWDDVLPTADAMVVDDIFGEDDGGEEIDVNAFANELDQQMEESDDDFLAAAVSPEPDQRQPISLKQFAGGEASEDDYTSSDDSDDD